MAVVLSEHDEAGRVATERLAQATGQRSLSALAGRTARSLGQIVLFGGFGMFGAAMSALIVPWHLAFVPDRVRRVRSIRRVIHVMARAFIGSMRTLRLIDLEVTGLTRVLPAGSLVVANHPSLIDALILLGHIKDAVVVAKRSLQVNPFTSGGIRGADYVVATDAPALIDACRMRIAAGESLVLFPECTRTSDDGVIRLRRGAAHIAVRSGCALMPVTIEFSEPLLTKQSRWWLAPKTRPRVRVVAHEPIDPAQFGTEDQSVSLAARRLTEHLHALYVKEIAHCGSA